MNIEEYISSGIVESYVLGLTEKDERAEFEKMCLLHPEIKAARDSFELLLEKQAMASTVQPPDKVKDNIFAIIKNESLSSSRVITMSEPGSIQAPVAKINWMRYLAAAAVLLLIASTALNVYFFSQVNNYRSQYANLLAKQEQLASNNNSLEARLQSFESAIAMIKDPNTDIVKMPGAPTSPVPGSLATVYWNNRTKDVYLMVNNLPNPQSGKQYQLWAIVDGKPVDAGVFDTQTALTLVKMKNIPKAQAFAITLENAGGSLTPTMNQMYVIGNVET
ncbi:MAG: anti-sigma factor [Chitinophagaceae bacterium]